MADSPRDRDVPLDESPPFARSWLVWYAVVLGWLALLIVAFYTFTQVFDGV